MSQRRIKRMERHHKRKQNKPVSLNLVSLMDIFTILVLFLIINASTDQPITNPKSIELPESWSDDKPRENVVITVNEQFITVQSKNVASIKDIRENTTLIRGLYNALKEEKAKRPIDPAKQKKNKKGRPITIMGDKEIPYDLLKKVMLTCASAEFTNISLAVVQRSATN